jgi:hypothetical protein
MFFNKKNKTIKCKACNSKIEDKFNFCPYCSSNLSDPEREAEDFGLLGKTDAPQTPIRSNLNFTDRIFEQLMNSAMKMLANELKGSEVKPEIRSLPNGIKIRIGSMPNNQIIPEKKQKKSIFEKQITVKQMEKMSNLPRAEAKSKIRRLSDKVIFELSAPGVESIEDIFFTKIESGYEIKAIGKNKVYTNNLPTNLPLKQFSISEDKVFVEFLSKSE